MKAKRGEEIKQDIVKDTPPGRLGAPDDIAKIIGFPASDRTRWITPQAITVAGRDR